MDTCRICGCKDVEYVQLECSHPPKNEVGKKYEAFFCKKCGCLQRVSFPGKGSDIYDENYVTNLIPQKTLKNMIWDKYAEYTISRKGLFGRFVSLFYKPVDYSFAQLAGKNAAVLDVGCGGGYFLTHLYNCGYTDLTGLDPFLPKRVRHEGIQFIKQDVFSLSADKKYDLITLINVFEHLEEPQKTFEALSRLVSRDGYIVMVLPVINTWLWDQFGTSIWTLSPWEHMFIHTAESMTLMAGRCGLRLIDFYSECSTVLWADKENMDAGRPEKNNERGLAESVWCALTTKRKRKKIDDKKMGNIGTFVFRQDRETGDDQMRCTMPK